MDQIKKYILPTSRYSNTKAVEYGVQGKLTFPIYKKKNLSFAPDDKYYEITKDTEFRPDKVSFILYGLPDYWWRIMELNGMKDILEFRAGRTIRLPGGTLMN